MWVKSLMLLDISGYAIIGTIAVLTIFAVVVNLMIHRRYRQIENCLRRQGSPGSREGGRVIARIVRDAQDARERLSGEINTQAIIELNFNRELRELLIGERFVKAVTGTAGVFNFATLMGSTPIDPSRVSDHYPVYANFYKSKDTDGPR